MKYVKVLSMNSSFKSVTLLTTLYITDQSQCLTVIKQSLLCTGLQLCIPYRVDIISLTI